MKTCETITELVRQHLQVEMMSGDLSRIKTAYEAMRANEIYGIGNWCRSGDLKGLPFANPTTGRIIPLSNAKVK